MEWALLPLKRYAEFTGRSRRKEYWMFVLLMVVVGFVAGLIEGLLGLTGMIGGVYGPISLLIGLAFLVPSISVSIRRLHDSNRSGWWLLIVAIPYALTAALFLAGSLVLAGVFSMISLVAVVVLLVLMVIEGTKGPNQYGPDPLEGERAAPTAT
jgi:uncharacterized membrane protein YhaH (DUF805 family)